MKNWLGQKNPKRCFEKWHSDRKMQKAYSRPKTGNKHLFSVFETGSHVAQADLKLLTHRNQTA